MHHFARITALVLGAAALSTTLESAVAAQASTRARPSHPSPRFRVVDALPHQDSFHETMLAGDADRDGLPEIVIVNRKLGGSESQIELYEDDRQGGFELTSVLPASLAGLLAIGDVDADGRTDVFVQQAGAGPHTYDRYESPEVLYRAPWRTGRRPTPSLFPDRLVWSTAKEGNARSPRGLLADVDGDGVGEFVVSDNGVPGGARLKIFESRPGNQMTLTFDALVPDALGNPVAGDLDGDGRTEIVVASTATDHNDPNALLVFEAEADDQFKLVDLFAHNLFNAHQIVLVDGESSPDGVPRIYLAGQRLTCNPSCEMDYFVQVYDAPQDDTLRLVGEIQAPALVDASIPQISSADIFGSPVAEIVLARLGGPIPVYELQPGGTPRLFDVPMVGAGNLVLAVPQTRFRPGAIAVGTHPSGTPDGDTLVLRLP